MTKRNSQIRPNRPIRLIGFMLLALGMASPASAQHSVLQALNFGEWVITKNNTPQTATIQTNGSNSHSSAMIMLTPPQPGIYLITDLPINMTIQSVDVTMMTPMQSMGQSFSIDNFTTELSSSNTGPTGETTLTLGATATSSANGALYPDSTYSGDVMIVLNF